MAADIGHGCQVQRSSDGTSGGTFASIGTIYEFSPPSVTRETVDNSSHASTERWRDYIAGMKAAGTMSLDIVFDPGETDVTGMYDDLNTDSAGYYKIIFNDDGSTEWGFSAFITNIAPAAPMDDKRMLTVEFQLTGKPGWIS